ncbi:thioredoxin family protein [Robertmurraya yapensis]|uniref:Thioredoxin family protein n=1 Tax=Bacillus yapensis TaxID=2492960 RepID=A0A3S0I7U2_9BACI|nr:thioredoxin family protein [Bacillus yapensis]RTR26753.1 thioredoxin family protein [Bacillus yapensis]TKS93841.1 thioredoxin family protein [Bacillus yapensis]
MNLLDWFNKGLTYEEYKGQMKMNLSEMNAIYEQFEVNDERLSALTGVASKVIVLTEDWCGDALMNNPILMRIAEKLGLDVRFVLRDSNLELMDQYLTNGTARSIPIFIFIDDEGNEKAVWGPRAAEAQSMVDSWRSELPAKEAEDFEEKQKAMFRKIKQTYAEDTDLWNAVANSIIAKLENVR